MRPFKFKVILKFNIRAETLLVVSGRIFLMSICVTETNGISGIICLVFSALHRSDYLIGFQSNELEPKNA